jgi:hypothetical protein
VTGSAPSADAAFISRGGVDGFSAADVALCLHLTGEVVPELEGYAFENVGRLREDWRQDRFGAAIARARTGQGGRASPSQR